MRQATPSRMAYGLWRRRIPTRAFWLACLALVACVGWASTEAYLKLGIRLDNHAMGLRWPGMPVRYFLNDTMPDGVTIAEFESAVAAAGATWAAVPGTGVSFERIGNFGTLPGIEDGVSVIGFDNRPDLDRVLGVTSFVVDGTSGAIVESDILLNSAFPWSAASAGAAGRYDVQSIVLHELGHLLGLGHSALGETDIRADGARRVIASGAVMFPVAFSAGHLAGRSLQADDVAGLSDVYDALATTRDTGSITGRVVLDGRGVYGAHVVAFNPATGAMVGTFTLSDDGSFAIAGITPGAYVLRVEPLDDADLNGFFPDNQHVDVGFGVAYLPHLAVVPKGGNVGPFVVTVKAR